MLSHLVLTRCCLQVAGYAASDSVQAFPLVATLIGVTFFK